MTSPIVHFPNLTAKAHNAILTLVVLAWHLSRLPSKYNHVYHNLPARREEWMMADNFADAFKKLGEIKPEEIGEIAGVNLKFLVSDIAVGLFRRANSTCERIQNLARSAASAQQVEKSPELQHFVKDLITLKAILDSRRAFIPRDILLRYVELSESIVAYVRGMPEAEALNRKIRAITKPRTTVPQVQTAPVAVVAPVEVQDEPKVEQKVFDVSDAEPLL